MQRKEYASLDVMKYISALFVITIHTAPFIQVSTELNAFIVQVIARAAVPFYFMCSGFLFFRGIDIYKGIKDPDNLAYLKHYLMRLGKIYLIWTAIYFIFQIVLWVQGGFNITSIIRYLRDFFLTGSYYHLWFLPSLMVGTCIIYVASQIFIPSVVLAGAFFLYIIGMMGNVYGDVMLQIPVLSTVLSAYESVFVTTRNGLFFGCIFIALGSYFHHYKMKFGKRLSGMGTLVSFVLLYGEYLLLEHLKLMNDMTSMYLMLIPLEVFMFALLLQIKLPSSPLWKKLRGQSLLIYVSHVAFSLIINGIFQLFHMVVPNLILFILTLIVSVVFAWAIDTYQKNIPLLKHLY